MGELSGGTVVVTGAATGVGRGLAREAALRGARVLAVDREDPAETVAMIVASGGNARGVVCDVRDEVAMRELSQSEASDDDPVTIVCANAGIGAGGTIDEMTVDGLRGIFEVNVFGVFNTIHSFVPTLRATKAAGRRPAILVTGSEHSLGVPPYVPPMTAYTASKHALLGLVAAARRDLAADGIGISILCPSYVATERLQAAAAAMPAMREALEVYSQSADAVARAAFDGLAAGAFVIPTNPVSSEFVINFHSSVIAAMQALGTDSLR